MCYIGITDQWYWDVYGTLPHKVRQRTFSMNPVLIRPRSIGRLMLRSANFSDHPKIHLNYFDDIHDLLTMVEGVRLVSYFLDIYLIVIYVTSFTFQDSA